MRRRPFAGLVLPILLVLSCGGDEGTAPLPVTTLQATGAAAPVPGSAGQGTAATAVVSTPDAPTRVAITSAVATASADRGIGARADDAHTGPLEQAPRRSTDSSVAARQTGGQAKQPSPAQAEAELYSWEDGDRTRTFALDPRRFVERRPSGKGPITEIRLWWPGAVGDPVFRSDSEDPVFLPGGVLLMLDPDWDRSRVDRFFLDRGISRSRVQERSFGENAFFIETAAGNPALREANALAGREGVVIASPNWFRSVKAISDRPGAGDVVSELVPGDQVQGSIAFESDASVYRITLPADTDLWLYTTGDIDTAATLLDADGLEITSNDNGLMPIGPFNFSIRRALVAGTYYIRVVGANDSAVGLYTLHAVAVTDPGSSQETATKIAVGSLTPGLVGEIDVFTFELSEPAYIWMMVMGEVHTRIQLLDSSGAVLDPSPQSGPHLNRPSATIAGMPVRVLRAGTYYVTVERYFDYRNRPGHYVLFLEEVGTPGSSPAAATPLSVLEPATGRISSADDQHFFSITLQDDAYVFIDVMAFSFPFIAPMPLDLELIGENSARSLYVMGLDEWGWRPLTLQHNDILNTSIWGELEAGTHHIRVGSASPDGYIGSYLIQVGVDTSHADLARRCDGGSALDGDPLFGCQWSLRNTHQFGPGAGHDIRAMDAWTVTKGEGVGVAIVDNGMDYLHRDLAANVVRGRNHDYDGGIPVLEPLYPHGTKVAGIIAARDNDVGVRGVAPRASIYAFDAISDDGFEDDHVVDAMTRDVEHTAVMNNSWGQGSTPAPKAMSASWESAIQRGIERGFEGKGTLYVWSGGNGFQLGANSNLDELKNHVGVTAVCAVNYADTRAYYSDIGANLWVCAPSGEWGRATPEITTTTNGSRYDDTFSGTSAAAPVVSGVAALIRSVNRHLTWRDVKLILAGSARKNDERSPSWLAGAARYGSAGESYSYSHQYGFGVVDAAAAVTLADSWTNAPPLRELKVASDDATIRIPDRRVDSPPTVVTSTVTVDPYVDFVEFVEVNIDWDHDSIRDLQVDLVSPSGRVSHLVPSYDARGIAYRTRFRFGSARHLGESAAGVWTLSIADHFNGHGGAVNGWSLKLYGHGYVPGFPDGTSATPGSGSLIVAWDGPDDTGGSPVTSYDLRYIPSSASTGPDPGWILRTGIETVGSQSYTLVGLTGGVLYDLQVRAVNSYGSGPWSDAVSAVAGPLVPPAIKAVEPRTEALVVSWSMPAGQDAGTVASYDLRYTPSESPDKADPNWTVLQGIRRVGDGDVRYVVRGLRNGTAYDVQLRAANGGDHSDWSPASVGTPADGLPIRCLRGTVAVGLSLVVFEGGSVEELAACAQDRRISALHLLRDGAWDSYILGAPQFVNASFSALYADGLPALTPLVVASEGPPSQDPARTIDSTEPWVECLRGELARGFSLVVYAGGDVDELGACAEEFGISAIFALVDGEYVSYIPGAPEFVNAPFRELFIDGIPVSTPLIVGNERP